MIVFSHGVRRCGRRAPGEGGVDDAALEIERRAVALVEGQVIAGFDLVAEQRRVPLQLADQLLGVGIEQELVRIEAVAGRGLVRAMHAISVDRAGARVRKVAVPDFVGVFGQAMRSISRWPPASNRQSSTLVALAENRAKLTPSPSHVAPSG